MPSNARCLRLRSAADLHEERPPVARQAARSADIRTFRRRVDRTGITPVVSHASYLINLATASPTPEPTIEAFIDELDRAHALGLLGVVIHPGVCTTGSEEAGLRRIADATRRLQGPPRHSTMVLLEHTAGQGGRSDIASSTSRRSSGI
jgi:deoxyribonuclease-4